jgi:hypothetical protein
MLAHKGRQLSTKIIMTIQNTGAARTETVENNNTTLTGATEPNQLTQSGLEQPTPESNGEGCALNAEPENTALALGHLEEQGLQASGLTQPVQTPATTAAGVNNLTSTIATSPVKMMLVTELTVHPTSMDTYGATESIKDLLDSFGEVGILDPLTVTFDGRILNGQRRFRAAKELGIKEVPVRVFESTDETTIQLTLLEHNRYRMKNGAQIGNETALRKEIRRKLKEQRNSMPKAEMENLPPLPKGKTRDIVGKEVGVSGKTAENAARVNEVIKDLKKEGKKAEAKEVETALAKSTHAGHKLCKDKGYITTKAKATNVKAAEADLIDGEFEVVRDAESMAALDAYTPEAELKPLELPAPAATHEGDADGVTENSEERLQAAYERAYAHGDALVTFLRREKLADLSEEQQRGLSKLVQQINKLGKNLK